MEIKMSQIVNRDNIAALESRARLLGTSLDNLKVSENDLGSEYEWFKDAVITVVNGALKANIHSRTFYVKNNIPSTIAQIYLGSCILKRAIINIEGDYRDPTLIVTSADIGKGVKIVSCRNIYDRASDCIAKIINPSDNVIIVKSAGMVQGKVIYSNKIYDVDNSKGNEKKLVRIFNSLTKNKFEKHENSINYHNKLTVMFMPLKGLYSFLYILKIIVENSSSKKSYDVDIENYDIDSLNELYNMISLRKEVI